MQGCALRKIVEKEDCFLTYEWLYCKKWKPETVCVIAHPSLLFLFRSRLTQFSSKVAVLKVSENSAENLVLVTGIRPSYLQKLDCTACFLGIFEAANSRKTFDYFTSPVSSTIIFLFHTKSLFHVQHPSLV